MLNESQQKRVLAIWQEYVSSKHKFINASTEYDADEFDKLRNNIIPEIRAKIASYLSGTIALEQFKTEIDSVNKRHRLWGFRGMAGQMFFNMLYNSSSGAGVLDKFDSTLKQCILEPKDLESAKTKIDLLSTFSNDLGDLASSKSKAPKTGSCPFFISYFWQIQNASKFPVYYKSMVDVLSDESLLNPSGLYSKDYAEFYDFNHEVASLIKSKTKEEVSLWDVEHAFWQRSQKQDTEIPVVEVNPSYQCHPTESLPTSFIPPVVSILSLLAKNDPGIAVACQKSGISTEKVFEDRIGILFRMAGYSVEPNRGQGYGRVPDGIAICREYHYAIIYDAKVRQGGYSIGTDDRAIKEYIFHESEILKRQGIRNVYFAVISSSFNGEFDDVIRSLKIETEIREVLFIEASALLAMLEEKLRSPELDLGPKGIQSILAESGVIKDADMREFLGV